MTLGTWPDLASLFGWKNLSKTESRRGCTIILQCPSEKKRQLENTNYRIFIILSKWLTDPSSWRLSLLLNWDESHPRLMISTLHDTLSWKLTVTQEKVIDPTFLDEFTWCWSAHEKISFSCPAYLIWTYFTLTEAQGGSVRDSFNQ